VVLVHLRDRDGLILLVFNTRIDLVIIFIRWATTNSLRPPYYSCIRSEKIAGKSAIPRDGDEAYSTAAAVAIYRHHSNLLFGISVCSDTELCNAERGTTTSVLGYTRRMESDQYRWSYCH